MDQARIQDLAKAVNRWLSFQRLCGRGMLFSESYLSQPIAEFILRHHSGPIVPEYNHPEFPPTSRGRPKQVDFALLTRTNSDIDSVIEAKWVRGRDYPKQAIVDDLLRLECLHAPSGRYVRRYFLLAGQTDHVACHFEELTYRQGGRDVDFTPHFLSADRSAPNTKVDAYGQTGTIRKFFRSFQETYEHEIPKTFNTRLVGKVRNSKDITVYIWLVGSARNRSTFTADALW